MGRPHGFPPDVVAGILLRDGHRCAVCGRQADTANHRADRGHGGVGRHHEARGYRPSINKPSNGVAICWKCNGLIEDATPEREVALERGVKIHPTADPELTPCWSPLFQMMVLFGNDWTIRHRDEAVGAEVGAASTRRETAPKVLDEQRLRERKVTQ